MRRLAVVTVAVERVPSSRLRSKTPPPLAFETSFKPRRHGLVIGGMRVSNAANLGAGDPVLTASKIASWRRNNPHVSKVGTNVGRNIGLALLRVGNAQHLDFTRLLRRCGSPGVSRSSRYDVPPKGSPATTRHLLLTQPLAPARHNYLS